MSVIFALLFTILTIVGFASGWPMFICIICAVLALISFIVLLAKHRVLGETVADVVEDIADSAIDIDPFD